VQRHFPEVILEIKAALTWRLLKARLIVLGTSLLNRMDCWVCERGRARFKKT